MKKELGILILAFIATLGFLGSVIAQPTDNAVSSGLIINSPGTTVDTSNVASNTSGDALNNIGSNIRKNTTNIGGKYSGNSVTTIP